MFKEICNALALHYDPTIHFHMMSANKEVDQSLKLAHNIPFLISDITLYLQIYKLWALAYDILLGRPFDILTQSIVQNYADENQTIIFLNPNTSWKATVPTILCGSYWFTDWCAKKTLTQQDF